jgi:hypothetical protein
MSLLSERRLKSSKLDSKLRPMRTGITQCRFQVLEHGLYWWQCQVILESASQW